MNKRFKPHLEKLIRQKTSLGRDFDKGLCLDRNERVFPFPDDIFAEALSCIHPASFNAYPESEPFYNDLAKFLGLAKENLYVTNGITEGIRIAFETIISPGDRVAIITPTYPMYNIYGKIYQANMDEIVFPPDLSMPIERICEAVTTNTSLVCLPNPNLPIESVFSLPEIRKLANKCKECNSFLIVDEAYAFLGAKTAIPLLMEYDNIIIFQTFSKAFGLAGIRLGYIISSPKNIEYLSKTRSLVESNALSMAIGSFFLKRPEIMHEHVAEINRGRQFIMKELDRLNIPYAGGQVTNGMLILLKSKKETEEAYRFFRNKNIYIRGAFGSPIENSIRITLGPKNAMKIFLEVFKQWLNIPN